MEELLQGAYESIRTGILEPRGTEPERNHLENDPRRNWIGVWVRNEPAMFFLPLFGVGLGPTSRFNPPLIPFISDTTFGGWTKTRASTPHWWLSSLNPTFRGWTGTHILVQPPTVTFHLWAQLFGVELRPKVQPPTDTFHLWTFSGLNSDARFNPPRYLSSLNTTFRGWTQAQGSTFTDGFHLWTLLFGVELGPTSWFNPPLVPFIFEHNFSGLNSNPRFNPPLIPFISEPYFSGLNWDPHPGSTPHLYLSSLSTTFRGWTQTRGSTPHWYLSSLNLTFRGWTGTHILVQPLPGTFDLWAQLFGVKLRPEVQPRTDGFHLWTLLFGVELGPTSWFNPPVVPFISEHNFSGLNSDPRFNPPWWLSSLSSTFRGWTGTHILVQPPTVTFHLWTQLFGVELRPKAQLSTDGFHLWTLLFGVELGPTSWFNPWLVPFISEHNFSGLNSDPRFNPSLMAFISEPCFSGLNWDPHPGSTPHCYLSSLNTTFRGWTQTQGSTPHWWLSSLNPTFRGWTGTHILVQPLTGTFHLWAQLFGVELRPEVQPPHWYLSSLNLTFRGWTGTHILVQPLTGTCHLWAQLFGVELRPEVQPPTDGFHLWTPLLGVEPMPIAINMAYGGHTASINLLSTKQTVGIQTETEPISGSFTLREPKRTQTNQRLAVT